MEEVVEVFGRELRRAFHELEAGLVEREVGVPAAIVHPSLARHCRAAKVGRVPRAFLLLGGALHAEVEVMTRLVVDREGDVQVKIEVVLSRVQNSRPLILLLLS